MIHFHYDICIILCGLLIYFQPVVGYDFVNFHMTQDSKISGFTKNQNGRVILVIH